MAWQKERIEVPEDLTPSERQEIGDKMVAKMVEKAIDGIGIRRAGDRVRPRPFPAYTEAYEKQKGQSNVDLVLNGDMLAALDVLSHKKGSVLVGFQNGTKENSKAEGNRTGSYGGSPNPRRARDFLGLTKSEINAIVRSVRNQE